ncbi:reverse transcriptase domain-containing protein [Tanacetum coccineum]
MSPSQDSWDVVSHATPPPDTKPGLTYFPQFLSTRNSMPLQYIRDSYRDWIGFDLSYLEIITSFALWRHPWERNVTTFSKILIKSTHEQHTPTVPTSAVWNTGERSGPQGLEEPTPDEVLRELPDKNYHQLLPLIAKKMQKEKEQQDKLNAVKAHLLYGNETGKNQRNHEDSHYSESKTPTARTEQKRRHGNRRSRSPSPVASVFKRLKQSRPPSPRPRPQKEGGVFNKLGGKERSASTRSDSRYEGSHEKETEVQPRKRHHRGTSSRETGGHSESKDSEGGRGKDREVGNANMVSHTRVWFDKLPRESIDNYEDLRTTFRENYLQQTKHIKDLVEIHHIKQRDGESMEEFMKRYKAEILDVEGAPECMKISGFMHGITHPEMIKRLYEKILRSMDEMYRVTTSFLQGEVAAFCHSRKKAPAPWKQPEGGNKPNFKKGFKNKQRSDRKPDRFSHPERNFRSRKKKIQGFATNGYSCRRDPNKYCEFHADTGHSMDKCMQLRKQINEMIKSGKLSQFIKELKQNDKPKAPKKGKRPERISP